MYAGARPPASLQQPVTAQPEAEQSMRGCQPAVPEATSNSVANAPVHATVHAPALPATTNAADSDAIMHDAHAVAGWPQHAQSDVHVAEQVAPDSAPAGQQEPDDAVGTMNVQATCQELAAVKQLRNGLAKRSIRLLVTPESVAEDSAATTRTAHAPYADLPPSLQKAIMSAHELVSKLEVCLRLPVCVALWRQHLYLLAELHCICDSNSGSGCVQCKRCLQPQKCDAIATSLTAGTAELLLHTEQPRWLSTEYHGLHFVAGTLLEVKC